MNWAILAASPNLDQDWWKQIAPSRNEFGLVFVAVGVIAVLAMIWAIFIRKKENDGSGRYSYPRVANSEKGDSSSSSSDSGRQRRRKRKRRHRRNPTLAETGGLPPIRHEAMPDDPP